MLIYWLMSLAQMSSQGCSGSTFSLILQLLKLLGQVMKNASFSCRYSYQHIRATRMASWCLFLWVPACSCNPLLYIFFSQICFPCRLQTSASVAKATALQRLPNHLPQLCNVKSLKKLYVYIYIHTCVFICVYKYIISK